MALQKMLHNVPIVQECDATAAEIPTGAGYIMI